MTDLRKSVLGAALLSAIAFPSFAGGPAGGPESMEHEIIDAAIRGIDMYGEINPPPLDALMKSFLWDNRDAIDARLVSDERMVEALFCILRAKYEYDVPPQYDDFAPWHELCDEITGALLN